MALRAGNPLSVTRIVTELTLGPCASVGVHVKTPVPGSIPAPTGAPASRLKLKVCAGESESVAAARKLSSAPSLMVLLPMAANTGGVLGCPITNWPADTLAGTTCRFPSAASSGVGLLSMKMLLKEPRFPINCNLSMNRIVPSATLTLAPFGSSHEIVTVPLLVMVVPKFPPASPANPNCSTPT